MRAAAPAREIRPVDVAAGVPPKPAHRADVQGLRALAVLIVVLFHADLGLPGGYVGVDVFFVISGFVITRRLIWEQVGSGRIDLRRFFLRRVRRILPALSLTVSVTALATMVLGPLSVFADAQTTGLAAVLVNANNQLAGVFGAADADYFTPISELNPFLHTWSLSVEEQFYLVFPFIVAGAGWLGGRHDRDRAGRSIVAALIVIVAISFAASIPLVASHPELAFYLSPLRAWEFGFGALLVPIDRLRGSSTTVATALGVSGMALIAGAIMWFDEATVFPGWAALVPVVGTGLLLTAGAAAANPVTRILATRPAAFVGDVSYSWYLWHWPLLVFAAATVRYSTPAIVAAVLASLAIAIVSTVAFENPIRFADRSPGGTVKLAAACVVLPVMAILAATTARPALLASEPIREFNEIFAPHLAQGEECRSVVATDEACTWPVADAVGSAVLVGDSNAHHFVEGFVAGMHARGYDATLAYSPGCTFTSVDVWAWGHERPECAQFHDSVLGQLRAEPHDLVVVATAVDRYIEDGDVRLRASSASPFVTAPDDKAHLLADAYTASFRALESLDADVVFVRSIPELGDWYPHECSALTWIRSREDCGFALTREQVEEASRRGSAVERDALAASGMRSIDFTEVLCDIDRCATAVDGEWRWKDTGHITVGQSRDLSPWFAALVDR